MNDSTPTPRQEMDAGADADLVESARFPMDPIPLAFRYRVGLFIVAVVLLLLPLLYGAFIGLLGYGVWYHVTHHYTTLAGGGALGRLLLYPAPVVLGSLVTLFMVKPLFAPRGERLRPRTLEREGQPTLYAYVDALCDSLGARPPNRIDVDMEVDVSAHYQGGASGLLGREPVLTLGLPITGCLTISQWTGLLSYEFAHFTRGTGTHLRYVIGIVNRWFARVDERDSWDERIEWWARDSRSGFRQVMLLGSRLFAWFSRSVLGILGMIGVAASSFLSRQMALNADLHHARVSGSHSFRPTHVRTQVLAVAWARTNDYLTRLWSENRLVDDMVKLVVGDAERLTGAPDVLEEIEAQMAGVPTRAFDTHPSMGDRIRAVEMSDFPTVVRSDAPASSLFVGFEEISREMTLSLYSAAIGGPVEGRTVISAEQALQELDATITGAEALRSYFMGSGLHICGVFPTEPVEATEDVDAARRELTVARERMVRSVEATRKIVQRLGGAGATRTRVGLALRLRAAGVYFDAASMGVGSNDLEELQRMLVTAAASYAEAREKCGPAARESIARLEGSISLALHPEVREGLRHLEPSLDLLPGLRTSFAAMAPVWQKVAMIQDRADEIGMLARYAKDPESPRAFHGQLEELSRSLCDDLLSMREALDGPAYPYDQVEGDLPLADYLLPSTIEPNAEVGLIGRAFGERFIRLYYRMWSTLAGLAKEVEDWAELDSQAPQD